MLIDYV
jgi:hypothetical protein